MPKAKFALINTETGTPVLLIDFLNNSNYMENKDRDIILHRLDKNPANCYDNLKKLAQ